jgi:hypothetical protein
MNYGNNRLLFYRAYNRKFEIPTFITLDLKTADLDPYLGIYSATFPFNNSYKDNTKLMAQATGQGAFPLTAIKKTHSNLELLELH